MARLTRLLPLTVLLMPLLLTLLAPPPAAARSHGAAPPAAQPPPLYSPFTPRVPPAKAPAGKAVREQRAAAGTPGRPFSRTGTSSGAPAFPSARAARPVPGIPPGPKCMTDLELMAEAALAYLFRQEGAARVCDPLLKPQDKRAERLMTRMYDEIVDKHHLNFTKYQQAREKRFRRWYGVHWERALEIDRKQAQLRYLGELRLGPGVCHNLRTDMEILLSSGWDYLRAKLSFDVKLRRGATRMCK